MISCLENIFNKLTHKCNYHIKFKIEENKLTHKYMISNKIMGMGLLQHKCVCITACAILISIAHAVMHTHLCCSSPIPIILLEIIYLCVNLFSSILNFM